MLRYAPSRIEGIFLQSINNELQISHKEVPCNLHQTEALSF